MKKNLIILFAAAVMLTACDNWLDVNHDPNALEEIPTFEAMLLSTEIGVANNLMGWDFGFGGGMWVQYWTQKPVASQFKDICSYQPEDFNSAYRSLMAEPLMDMQYIKNNATAAEDKGYRFIAEALSIYTWQIVTDVWGDMPYFETLKLNMHPKQDKQQDIYADLNKRIDALLATDLSGAEINGNYDYIFAGNMEQWYRFANSLKLKLMFRLSETEGYNNAAVLSFIENNQLLEISASIPGNKWDKDRDGKCHPMTEFQERGTGYLSGNVIASKSFFDYLLVNEDPRFAKLFNGKEAAFFGDFGSIEDSDGDGTGDDNEQFAQVVFASDTDIPFISMWEINFQIAEVYARAGNDPTAKKYFENGVKASLAQHGITDSVSISRVIGENGYAKWQTGTLEAAIKQIAMQKWVANCNYQHIEAFLERNRTKYPAVNDIDIAANRRGAWVNFPVGYLTISVSGRATLNQQLPASPVYPEDYRSRNNNAPPQKPNVGQRVWWNQKTGK